MDKDILLDESYNKALADFILSLNGLQNTAMSEISISKEYADDAHVPSDALSRLEKALQSTQGKLRVLTDARSKLINYRFNR